MKLDRKVIKEQAKHIIKNNIWSLVIITLVVLLLSGGSGIYTGFANIIGDTVESVVDSDRGVNNFFGHKNDNSSDNNDDFFSSPFDNGFDADHFNNFNGGNVTLIKTSISDKMLNSVQSTDVGGSFSIVSIAMMPLTVTLWGVYLALIKGKKMELSDSFSYVFSKTFDKNYFKKFALVLMIHIFTTLLSFLFIIPGVIYSYKVRFAPMIMNEYPDLSPKEAIELSKKMTADHKGELFALDLSYIPWALLLIITLGIAGIYFIPYRYTVDSLYYLNFKARCEQEGRIHSDDYIPFNQRVSQMGGYQQPTYQQPQNDTGYYQPPQDNTDYYQPTSGNSYYSPSPAPTSADSYYQPPQDNAFGEPYSQPEDYTQDNSTADKKSDFGSNMGSDYWNNGNF